MPRSSGVASRRPERAGELDFTYRNSLSGTRQRAAGYAPGQRRGGQVLPLLVVAHFAGGTRHTARELGYYRECRRRGWLCVCPQLHGERMSERGAFGSLESQHDVLDVIARMREHYRVDPARIYIAGRSMGGMTAQLMAAKYPDLFAAAAAGQGIADLRAWLRRGPALADFVRASAAGSSGRLSAFECARRSSVSFAPNLRYIPLYLWHGTCDPEVPPSQSQALARAVRAYTPFQAPVHWLVGAGHAGLAFGPQWECEQLSQHQNTSDPELGVAGRYYRELELVTDEDKRFFWLDLRRRRPDAFGRVRASIRSGAIALATTNISRVTIVVDRLARGTRLLRWSLRSSTPVEVVLQRGQRQVRVARAARSGSGKIDPE